MLSQAIGEKTIALRHSLRRGRKKTINTQTPQKNEEPSQSLLLRIYQIVFV